MMNALLFAKKREIRLLRMWARIATLLPLQLIVHFNLKFAKYMAKNPAHGFARNMVNMIEERKKYE